MGFEVVSTLLGPEETGSHHRFWGVGLFHVFVKGLAAGWGGGGWLSFGWWRTHHGLHELLVRLGCPGDWGLGLWWWAVTGCGGGRLFLENCTVDASIFVRIKDLFFVLCNFIVVKFLRAQGECLGTRSR